MDLHSFAIGIVTMVAFALVITAVIGMLKVTALAKSFITLKRRLEDDEQHLSREINMVEKTMQNQISNEVTSLHQHIETAYQHSTSYTDKRIDKLIDTYFDLNKTKKLLKD
jgi:uncharacterized membrane protein YhiD involved in acid resistance